MTSNGYQLSIDRLNDWLKNDLRLLFDSLREDPAQGTALGKGCYKVRMAIASKK